jgi:hypothetical protein
MIDSRAAEPWDDGPGPTVGEATGGWEQKRDVIREIIRAEVDRARPIEEARRSIELIVETSIRPVAAAGATKLLVVDDEGRPRTVADNGEIRDFTLRDLILELRSKHRKLFQEESAENNPAEPVSPSPLPARAAPMAADHQPPRPEPVPASFPPTAPARDPDRVTSESRDWLDLTSPAMSRRDALTSKLRHLEQARQHPSRTPDVERLHPEALRSPFEGFTFEPRNPETERPIRPERPADLPIADLDDIPERRPWRAALVGLLLLLAVPALAYWVFVESPVDDTPAQEVAAAPPESQREFNETNSIRTPSASEQTPSSPEQAPAASGDSPPKPEAAPVETASAPSGPLQGVPEVLDTATLFLQGKIVPLFGVEWVRGAGTPEDLARYINGREVVCEEAESAGTYRCKTGTQDLSKVVLYNGGGRAKSDATPELKAAESAARSARRGLWASAVGGSEPE